MIFDNQLRYAVGIIASYQGESPLHGWLKNFFREHKQMGSKDRKLLSHMVYGFYRLGHAVKNIPVEERVLAGLFLCHEHSNDLLNYFKPDWNGHFALPIKEKIAVCRGSGLDFREAEIFPWKDELSEGIDHEALCLSFLRQPDLFLRIRPGYEQEVLRKIAQKLPNSAKAPISPQDPAYGFIPPSTLRLPNGFKVEELFTPDKEVVVQDYSSQRIAPFLQMRGDAGSGPLSIWDACAASGGKSILAHDLNPGIELTVSDIRESILHNLRQRFRQAGITRYHAFAADLTAPFTAGSYTEGRGGHYDLILADVPCSGSGTWSRTPEELYFFDPGKINAYHERQKNIISHIIPRLSKSACLVYCTCSVFKKENEGMAGLIRQSFGLQADRQELIKGYEERADSMFAARLAR